MDAGSTPAISRLQVRPQSGLFYSENAGGEPAQGRALSTGSSGFADGRHEQLRVSPDSERIEPAKAKP